MSAADAAPIADAEVAAFFSDLAASPGLILAVSGGADSTALLVLATRWAAALKSPPKLLAMTVDHGLRPESAAEAAAVKKLARRLGVAHRTLRWGGEKPHTGIQEAARAARYRLLAQAAQKAGARHVLTAHTLEDQAETILFRLARGSGITGLAGMARQVHLDLETGVPLSVSTKKSILLVRPLLDVSKVRLLATLQTAGIGYTEDPSNRDPRFARPRLRQMMAALAAEGLDAKRLAVLALRARRADEALERAADEALRRLYVRPGQIEAEAGAFMAQPAEIALRLLRRAIEALGDEGPVELGKLEALYDALQKAAAAPGPRRWRSTLAGAAVALSAERIRIERAPPRRRDGTAKRSKVPSAKNLRSLSASKAFTRCDAV
ncbi:MAG TPA: tRNA lysidine(34) synthetase TilS [Xanthobacteraceae bacterium]|nr:tRNA lysidine(34) synthetase TilS [Xanthobacteraceae bacterium]